MYNTQTLRIFKEVDLNVKLEKNKEITIHVEGKDEDSDSKYLKLVNVNGTLAIFVEGKDDVIVEEWEGSLPYKKALYEIEEEVL